MEDSRNSGEKEESPSRIHVKPLQPARAPYTVIAYVAIESWKFSPFQKARAYRFISSRPWGLECDRPCVVRAGG